MSGFIEKVRKDLAWFNVVNRRPVLPLGGTRRILLRALKKACMNESFYAVFLYRLSYSAKKRGHRFWSWYFAQKQKKRFGNNISSTAAIEGGFRLPHPYGVTIGAGASIGTMVTIGQHVTLGGNMGKRDEEGRLYPAVGNWCWIAAGAVLAGPISIGEDVIVGANAVVVKDVQKHSVVGGVPAKRIREKPDDQKYFGYPNELRMAFEGE